MQIEVHHRHALLTAPRAMNKLERLAADAADRHALVRTANDKLADAERRLVHHNRAAEAYLKRDENVPDQIAAQLEASQAQVKFARLHAEPRDRAYRAAMNTLGQALRYLDTNRGKSFIDTKRLDQHTVDVASVPDELTEKRGQIDSCRAEIQEVTRAPIGADVVEKQVRQIVEKMAARGKPNVRGLDGQAPLTVGWEPGVVIKPIEFHAWLDPETMIRRIMAGVPNPTVSMSADQKAKRLATLQAELLKLEHEEEAIIEAVDGLIPIERRLDANPVAILGVAPGLPVVKAA